MQHVSSRLLFDPRGIVDQNITPVAPRKTKLEGLRLGILDNSKWNANQLLRSASAALSEDIKFAAVNYYVKQSFSKDAAPELIEQIARENDIVLTAIGDCGFVLLMLHPGFCRARKAWHSFGSNHHRRIRGRDKVDPTSPWHAGP